MRMDDPSLKPGDEGYLGHRRSPGRWTKKWRPMTYRNRKKLYRNKENWKRFKATAGIDGRITFASAWHRAEIHFYTLSHYVNGMTDMKLSTAIDFCDRLGCDLNGLGAAMKEAWEIMERRAQAEEAIEEAKKGSEP